MGTPGQKQTAIGEPWGREVTTFVTRPGPGEGTALREGRSSCGHPGSVLSHLHSPHPSYPRAGAWPGTCRSAESLRQERG